MNVSVVDFDDNSSAMSTLNGKGRHISTDEEKLGELVHIIFGGVLIIVGTIGNCFSLIILRTGDLKKLSTCFCMSMLAIADLGNYLIICQKIKRLIST